MTIKLLELFGGVGAASKALKEVTGNDVEVVDYVEKDRFAVASYNAINGTSFEPQDITQHHPDSKTLVDILMHGSPCFLAGESVNTLNGFKNIEDIQVGDYVLSHDGSYNKVLQTMKNKNNRIYDLKCGATHMINTTFNHPFYVLRDGLKQWVQAEDLTTNDYMMIPINLKQDEIEWDGVTLNYNNHSKKVNNLPLKDTRFWYLVGRFIGDGWVIRRTSRNNNISGIKICCGKDKLKGLTEKLEGVLGYSITEERTVYKLHFCNKELGEFCSQFGIGAENKYIPPKILNLKNEYLHSLLQGILDSDGYFNGKRYKVTSVSKSLVYSIGELVLKLYHVPYHISKSYRPKKCFIENRIVNQKDTYEVYWSKGKTIKNINFVDGRYLYSRIRKIKNREETNDVYNIEVENTHSYCVNNIATHNCQDFSVSGRQAGGVKGSNTRSSLLYETIRIIDELEVKPRYVVWENVKNVLSKNHFAVFNSYLQELKSRGYTNYFKVLNAKDHCIPQNRERLFVVSCFDSEVSSYAFPAARPLNSCMRDFLIPQTDESSDEYPAKYLYQHNDLRDYDPETNTCLELVDNYQEILDTHEPTDRLLKVAMLAGGKYAHRFQQVKRVYWEWGLCPTITTQSGGGCEPKVMREYDVAPYFRIRDVRAIEQWRLMGFSDEDFDKAWPATGLSFKQMKKQAGNSICVPVLRAVFAAMKL